MSIVPKAPSRKIRCGVSVQILPAFEGKVSPRWLRALVETSLDVASDHQDEQTKQRGSMPSPMARAVGVVVTDDETVHKLNATYRGLDETTDVLAFSWQHQGSWEGEEEQPLKPLVPFPPTPSGKDPLGEVVISYPQAERQALERGHPVRHELSLLLVHGMLHLLGYDHGEPQDESRMKKLEALVLSRFKSWRSTKGEARPLSPKASRVPVKAT